MGSVVTAFFGVVRYRVLMAFHCTTVVIASYELFGKFNTEFLQSLSLSCYRYTQLYKRKALTIATSNINQKMYL